MPVVKSSCMMCHGGCGILVHVENGRVVKVTGDPESRNSRGWLCAKGLASADHLYHKDRLMYPMKRAGARGEGRWERISWEEAISTMAKKLDEIRKTSGPEAMAIGDGTRGNAVGWILELFCYLYGSTNRFGSGLAQCFLPRDHTSLKTYGAWAAVDFEGKPKCIVEWGDQLNVSNHNTILGVNLLRAVNEGARLITVDPRRTAMARKSDVWLRVRPGTDVALALSWMNVMIQDGLYDKEFVEKWTNAPFLVRDDNERLQTYDRVAKGGDPGKYVIWDTKTGGAMPADAAGTKPALAGTYLAGDVECKPVWQLLTERAAEFEPEKAEKITWVPAEDIKKAARMYAVTKPAAISWGVGLEHNINTHQNTRAVALLQAISGNLDVPGGNVFFNPLPNYVNSRQYPMFAAGSKLPPEAWDKQLGGDKYKLFAGRDAKIGCLNPILVRSIITGKPYRVRAWLIFGSNPILGWANSREVYEALKKVEFLVVGDLYMTPTAELADIVLPCPTYLEKDRLNYFAFVNRWGEVPTQKAVEPLGECRDEFEVFGELAGRLGFGDKWPGRTAREFYDKRLQEAGTSWEEVCRKGGVYTDVTYRKYETDYYRKGGGFKTPTGKVEVYSTVWKDLGYDPIPSFTEPPESPHSRPDLAEKYPFVLISGARIPGYFHTQFRQIQRLRKLHPDPLFQIHPEAASKLGINDGDWCWIETPRGRIKQRARIFDGIDPRVVHAEHDWWFPEKPGAEPELHGVWESNVNVLMPSEPPFLDPGYGGTTLRGVLCKVYKV